MAEGQRFSERKSRLQDFKAGLQGDQGAGTQQTQQTQQDTSGQQATGGVFLPGINTDYSSTLPKTGYQGALESGKIQSNVVLPGINDKPKIENATLDTTTIEQQRRANIWAKNNSVDTQSTNEKINDELNSTGKILGQYDDIVKTYWRGPINNYKKRGVRALWDSGLAQNFVKKTLKDSGINLSDKNMDAIDNLGEKIVVAYNNKINEDFQKIVNKNLDPRFLEKYNNESITDLIGQGDFAGAGYKILRGTTENRQMIPEMAMMIALPPLGLTVMGADVYVQENQGTFEDMMNSGATYEQARNGAIVVGMVNSAIELFMERLLGGAKWAGATAFRRLFIKEVQQEVVRNATKKGFAEILSRGIGEMLKGSFIEGLEEVFQQIVGNAMVKLIDPNRKISEGVFESFEGGFYNLFNAFAGGGKMLNDYSDNKKIDMQTDLEALQYVMEGEERKAQRMQQAKQRMKDRFLGKDTTEEFTQEDQEQFEREGVEEQQQSDELRTENNRETTIQNEMEREVLSEGDLNEDLGDPRFQKTEATDTNEINKDLKDIKDSLEKMDDNTFFNRIMASINKGGKRNFVVFNKNGQKSVLRVMETKSKGKGSGKTVTVQVMQPSKKSGNVIMSQFTYNPGNLSIEQKQGIITGFENWGKTGKFTDNTSNNEKYQLKYEEKDYNPGVANKNEKNISGKEGVKQRNKINDETIEQLAKKYGVKVEVIKGLVKVLKNGKWTGGYAYGKYLDQVLTLSEQIKESTAPHELLHAIFDMIDPETKAYLISQVMKSEGWSAKKAEEWLADSFSNFFRTGKIEGAPKSTWGKIKIFFKRVRSFINGLGRWRSELEEIFSDIITSEGIEELQGRIDQNQRLQEAKARMRERFMQYAKNAEKMQKKAEKTNKSEAKYQEAEQDGISALQKIANGAEYVRDAMNREDLKQYGGETGISFYWGEPGDKSKKYKGGYGISHIAEKHGADTLLKMIEVLARGKITRYAKSIDRVSIGYDGYTAILSLSKDNGKETRLVTGRKDNEKKTDGSSEVSTQSTPTQTSPTFSRTDLGAVLSKDIIYKNDKNANKNAEKLQIAGDINSEAFKKRFGDSKVVDKNGNPLVVYHGTPYGGFTVFSKKNSGSIGDAGYFGDGYYFTSNKNTAKDYSDEAFIDVRTNEPGEYGNVEIKEVYLKIENPYEISDKDVEYEMGSLEKLLGTKNPSESTKKLQEMGYDGVIYTFNKYGGDKEYTVFEPNQIKSATDNVGTYDPNNDDIRYQTVYHGSRAEFDKFDSSHMGEGEGDQVHGRGHYVAVDPKTAKRYAELGAVLYKGKQIGGYDNILSEIGDLPTDKKNFLKDIAYDVAKKGKTVQEAKDDLINKYKGFIKDLEESVKDNEKNLEKLEKSGKTSRIDYNQLIKNGKDYIKRDKELLKIIENIDVNDFSKRNFYEVEIPDPVKADTPTGSNYFEEKKILNKEEINRIMDALLKKKTKGSERVQKAIDYDLKDGEDISGRSMVFNLRAGLGDKQASKFLESLGYDGIHYYGLRDGEAYVIFNDKALEITNHEKYQEADDIDPEARDPYKMISQTGKAGNTTNVTYVFDKFISEKAKDKALHSVPKEWLNEGKAPALMHTNKYVDKPFYKFDNVKDSRYKRVKDGIVVSFFTDNFYMSQSYARGIPTVAKTKKGNISDAELKQELKRMSEDNSSKGNESLFGGLYSDKETKFSTQKNKDGSVSLVSKQKFYQHYDYERFIRDYTTQINLEKMGITYSEVFKDPDNVIDFLIENVNKTFDGKDAYVKASREDNGVLVEIYDKSIKGTYPSMEELKDNVVRYEDKEDMYSYIGYGQNINKLLLLDQFKGEYWNQMGRLDDVFNLKNIHYEKEVWRFIDSVYKAMDGLSYRMEAFKERYNDSEFNRNTYDESGKMREEVRIIGDLIGSVDGGVISMMDNLRDLLEGKDTTEAQQNVLNSYTTGDLTTRGETVRDALEELYDFLDHNYNELRRLDWNGIKDWIYSIGGSEGDIAVLEHHYNTNWSLMKDTGRTWKEDMARDLNPKFNMETNDWVRYAIAEGYDAIKMEEIYDYGGNVDYELPGNIYVTLRNNEFKAWDNADPTDSSDIRYQTVYHGSRADFENFDSTHMGEGEGNQAHGRGHYVAVDPATARHYAEITGKGDYTWGYDGKTYNDLIREYISGGRERGEIALLTDLIQDMGNTFGQYTMQEIIDKRIERAEKALKNDEAILREEKNLGTPGYATVEDIQGWIDKDKKTLEMLKSIDVDKFYEAEPQRKRNFYEVEIPDPSKANTPTRSNYLEEGKPITRSQYEKFKNELDKYVRDYVPSRMENMLDVKYENLNGWGKANVGGGGSAIYDIAETVLGGGRQASKFLESLGYDGIHYFGGRDGEAYVIFDDNDLEITNHEKYQLAEYEYDENGNRKWLKFGDNSERDPSIFGTPTREEQIEEDKENEKNSPFYNAWMKYNTQNYKDDQLTFEEFIQGISERADNAQKEYEYKMNDLAEAQNDPYLLDLQLRAVKLMEEEGKVGKKFGKNVSKEVRDRQQAEVEKKREQLIQDIVDYMYPGLRTEEITYDMQKEADQKEAEWEMLGKEGIEEKLKYFKKDKNGNWEAKTIKIENPQEKLDKLLSAGKFDEIFTPLDRVLEWKTPQGQKGILDNQKDPKKYKSVLEKINKGTTKTKVTLKDVTRDYRALEKYRAEQEAEKERRKKERQEEFAKKKQEEYKKLVRMSAFQRLIDMQRLEKYPFLSENEIKERYGFTDEEWKKITEQEEIKLPKKWGDKARSDFNKAVDSYVRDLIKGLDWQNKMKQREAEKNLGEIGEIDVDVLLGRDEEKGQKEVEEFEKISKNKQPEDKKKKAEELTKKRKVDVQEMFRKAEEKRNERYANKEEKIIDEVKTEEEAKNITNESRWKKAKNWVKETTIQDLIQPISSRIEQISPRIYLEMMRFEQNISVKTNIRMKQVEDFVNKMAEIRRKNKKDYINITLHLLNGNVGTANQMLEKYGASIPRQVLDEIWADAEDVGYTMNYEGFYYPRKVKDVKEFLERFAKVENKDIQGEIDKIVSMAEKKARDRGEEFTPQQKADLINQLLMDGEVEGISLGSGHMKKRKVESITKNMLEFYEDPVDALLQYISGMTEAIEKARLLGQSKKGEIRSLGQFIADEGIEGWNADELKKILMARFNYAPMSKGVAGLKNIANIIHLGSPSSALSQLADISFSLIENGLTNIVQGLAGKYNLDLDALGVTNRGEELKSQGKNETAMDKIQRFTFKMTGFNMMDQFGKKLLVVSTLNKLIKYAKNNDPQLRKDLSRRFDDPKMIDQIIEDLKNGVMSENVNLFLFTKLADVQPLTRTQMPKTYLTSGNGRIFYQFKTFAVKQLDYLIQKGKRDLKNKGTAKGLRSIVVMMGIIMLCGAGADELKDFTMGRKYSSWIWRMINDDDWSVAMLSDRFWDNLLKLTGLTKYSIYQARTQGIKSTVEDLFFSLSSLDVLTYPMQDIQDAFSEDGLDFSQASSWQLIPIVGKYGYRWLGAGQTKQQKKLKKEKKKSSGGGIAL